MLDVTFNRFSVLIGSNWYKPPSKDDINQFSCCIFQFRFSIFPFLLSIELIGTMEHHQILISICFILIASGVKFTSAVCVCCRWTLKSSLLKVINTPNWYWSRLLFIFFQEGYSVELLKSENCPVDGPVAHSMGSDSSAFMSDDCDMVVRMCGDTVGYNSNMVKTVSIKQTMVIV